MSLLEVRATTSHGAHEVRELVVAFLAALSAGDAAAVAKVVGDELCWFGRTVRRAEWTRARAVPLCVPKMDLLRCEPIEAAALTSEHMTLTSMLFGPLQFGESLWLVSLRAGEGGLCALMVIGGVARRLEVRRFVSAEHVP